MDGKLIVFEGIEGCGKTTQLERSRQWLRTIQSADVISTREPGGTQLGASIRQLLLHSDDEPIHDRTELLLYAADRAQHVEHFLRPHLERGALILCDRYTDSTIAYQGYGRGLNFQLIDQLNQVATGGLQSDLTIWLDIDVEIGFERMKQRGKRDRIEQASLDFHRRVQMGFTKLAEENRDRIVRIDGSGSELTVAEQVKAALSQAFTRWGK
ncbi:MAG: dTMP kinase [Phormidium tanganyikae FI6-MK23]|jgi:dTMP kinase|nr:dTMP kinase [Phormidium tanganyikae FI6-MK23]